MFVRVLAKSLISLLFCFAASDGAEAQPNFVIILVDDGGLMDFGGYGGEARTPHIDSLGNSGVRFSNYHTSPLCAPSRAMLLTGLDSHRTGVGTIPEVITSEQQGQPGYQLHLLPEVETVAERLKAAGYATYMTGKWHLGREPADLPNRHGFDRSFALDASGADNWEQKPFMPLYTEAPWFEDGEPAVLPEDFYSSQFLVDKMIEYLDGRTADQPFLAYVAFQAIHIPIQAPREFTDRYEGVYSDGWDAVRQQRYERAREIGLIPDDALPPERHPDLRAWDSLSDKERAHYERSMMVNAGMLEAMDFHVGRLISYLEETEELENTVFIVTSDNGPEFNDPVRDATFRVWMWLNGYHADLDRMGEKGSMGAIGPEWASAAAAPGSLFKMYASEGGTRVPLIISGPGIEPQDFHRALSFVTDVAPTVLDLAGLPMSEASDGRSLVPLLSNPEGRVYSEDDAVGLEVAGNAALFRGHYKLTRNSRPHGDATWRLHDLAADPAEREDISEEHPALRAEMLAAYNRYAEDVGVVAISADFDIEAQIGKNAMATLRRRQIPGLIIAGAALIGVAFLVIRLRRRRGQRKA